VLFDDVRPFIFEIRTISKLKSLVGMFLTFLGTPFGGAKSSDSLVMTDPFLHDQLMYESFQDSFLNRNDVIGVRFPLYFHPSTPNSLYGSDDCWPSSFTVNDLKLQKNTLQNKINLVQRVLEQGGWFGENKEVFKRYLLWIEFLQNPEQAEKTAKKNLKTEPMNLMLWNMYTNFIKMSKGLDQVNLFNSVGEDLVDNTGDVSKFPKCPSCWI
jgi:hypothetical protein